MATIRKRNNKWQVQVRHLGHNQISKTFLRKQEAEQWARELEVSFDQGNLASRSFEYPVFSEIIERYTKEVSARKRGHKRAKKLESLFCLNHYIILLWGNSRPRAYYFLITPYLQKARKLES